MIQAVASEDIRSHLGMHYTSVPNIMKVNHCFWITCDKSLRKLKGNQKKLNDLYDRIGKIKFMDPACGSGNFLIITYKELRQLEIDILKELNGMSIAIMYVLSVTLDQFYGIEIDDFACIEAVGDRKLTNNKSQRKTDARLHVIYENGTENTPLLNGLAASMYGRNGKIVTESNDDFTLTSDDQVTGYIYVLKSESVKPEIRKIQENHSLYKVGYTSGSIEKRIVNAENESTYLYGPVKVCEEIQVAHLDSEALETAIHHALANYRLDVDIKAPNERMIHPREWFVTDLDTIDDMVNEIVSKLRMNQ